MTTFDGAVYNLVLTLAGVDKRPPFFPCQRIRRKNKKFFETDPVAGDLADINILGFAVKVNDDLTDGDSGRAFFSKLFFGRLIKKTIEKKKEIYDVSFDSIRKMDELQRNGAPLSEVLDMYGSIMSNAFRYTFDLGAEYLRVIDLIAQWTFFIDMLDDYDDDTKKGAVNTLIRSDCKTLSEFFDKHYNELLPVVSELERNLYESVNAISCDKIEWVVLHKIIGHSVATLVPNILNGKDVKFHYFRDTADNCKMNLRKKQIKRKLIRYEKNSTDN